MNICNKIMKRIQLIDATGGNMAEWDPYEYWSDWIRVMHTQCPSSWSSSGDGGLHEYIP